MEDGAKLSNPRERERGLRSIEGWREKFCVVRQPIQFISGLMGERECVCVCVNFIQCECNFLQTEKQYQVFLLALPLCDV